MQISVSIQKNYIQSGAPTKTIPKIIILIGIILDETLKAGNAVGAPRHPGLSSLPLPPASENELTPPPEAWRGTYERIARELGLLDDLDAAFILVKGVLSKIRLLSRICGCMNPAEPHRGPMLAPPSPLSRRPLARPALLMPVQD